MFAPSLAMRKRKKFPTNQLLIIEYPVFFFFFFQANSLLSNDDESYCRLWSNVGQVLGHEAVKSEQYPLVVSTWPFVEAVRAAWRAVDAGFSSVDAVIEGCSACEELRCDGTGQRECFNLFIYLFIC